MTEAKARGLLRRQGVMVALGSTVLHHRAAEELLLRFMKSDDIRSQLPEDSKRFEQLENGWKDLMMEASQSSLAGEICFADGRVDARRVTCDSVDSCEKALNDYLEQKNKTFPRFYLVAHQALLDVLSNSNRPLKAAE